MMQYAPLDTEAPPPPIEAEAAPKPPSTLAIDWTLFEHHLSGSDLTEEQKCEFLETIWYIVVAFVDLGFGIAPVQQALLAGQQDMPALPVRHSPPGAPEAPLTTTFGAAATRKLKSKAKIKTGSKKRRTT